LESSFGVVGVPDGELAADDADIGRQVVSVTGFAVQGQVDLVLEEPDASAAASA
jgi:hypothetical protein